MTFKNSCKILDDLNLGNLFSVCVLFFFLLLKLLILKLKNVCLIKSFSTNNNN